MPVYYNNKTIIPAPFANISMSKTRAGDSTQISNQYSITLTGSVLPFYSGIFDDSSENVKGEFNSQTALAHILEKQKELIELFEEDGQLLEIQGLDGSQPIKFLPKIESIEFGEGNWVNIANYTITMTASKMIYTGGEIPDQSEYSNFYDGKLLEAILDYSITNNNDGTAVVNRDITAKGDLVFDADNPNQLENDMYPYQWASGWCHASDNDGNIHSYFNPSITECLPDYSVIDNTCDIDFSRHGGTYGITRQWMVSNTGVYTVNDSYTKTEQSDGIDTTMSLTLDIKGIGFSPLTKYANAEQYWTDNSASTTDEKISCIKDHFSYVGANDGTWYYSTFSETLNKQEGTINTSLELTNRESNYHSYTIEADTDWRSLPEKTLSINGTITGTGDSNTEKQAAALAYYQTINFESLASGLVVVEFGSADILYLQSQNTSINIETGEVSYNRTYTSYETNYKDIWTMQYSQNEDGGSDSISVNGTLTGLSSNKAVRWSQVYSAFSNNFPNDSTVWTDKVVSTLGSSVPAYGNVTSRTFDYNQINGEINYAYEWTTSASSGQIDYSIDSSYDRSTDSWRITLNGTVYGAGSSASDKLANAHAILPGEYAAWNHAYTYSVSKLDDNSSSSDVPQITQIPDQRYLVSRDFGANEQEGTITFSFVWDTEVSDSGYSVNSVSNYSWDEQGATETVTVNGTIKGQTTATKTASQNLDDGWNYVYNAGNPTCPNSIFAARHTTYFGDQTNLSEQLPTEYPISSTATPTNALSFSRSATMQSATYAKDIKNNELTYTFEFMYRAWPYSLPLWLTDVSITFNKVKSVDVWAQHQIIGKRTGPIHQDVTSKTATVYDVSITLSASKRKSDQSGSAITTLLEEYCDYVLRQAFLERSGYTEFNYSTSDGEDQNCYIESDAIDFNIITGAVTRNTRIVMLNILT